MVKTATKLKLASGMEERSVRERLEIAGMKVTALDGDLFRVESNATGAILNRTATERDLVAYLRCIEHTAKRHGTEIAHSFGYTRPVHG